METCLDETSAPISVMLLSNKSEGITYCALKITKNPPNTCSQASKPPSGTLAPAATLGRVCSPGGRKLRSSIAVFVS